MKFTRTVALLAIIAAFGTESVHAQAAGGPAEFPPASYKSTQYVDSKGCVFIRAGIDGNVTWIPRVSRQRSQICGQMPSLSGSELAQASTRAPAANVPAPVQLTVEPPAPAQTVETIAPAPQAAPAAAPQRAPAPRVARAAPSPAPGPTVFNRRAPEAAAPAPQPQPVRRTVVRTQRVPSPAPGPTVFNRREDTAAAEPAQTVRPAPVTRRTIVRRAPTAQVTAPAPVVARTDPKTRVLPVQVFDERAKEIGANHVPQGFRPAWEDDRLNPRRAEQNLEGVARTRLVWTRTVPRRLIERSTGRDVTSTVALVYPYTDQAAQQRDLGTVTLVRRNGQLLKRVQRNSRAKARTPSVATQTAAAAPVAPKAVRAPAVKTAKAAPRPTAKAQQKGRYVQVGTFGVPSNAQATARRLQAAGLPARIGTLNRGGKSYQVVMAGPFTSSDGLNRGLRSARSMGFGDAFVR